MNQAPSGGIVLENTASPRRDWYRKQIQRFRDVQPRYREFARSLERILKQETGRLGLHAIVQSRPKSIASFAEKIQRKGKQYTDPLRELTDLCGARVITHTLSEVAAVCRFIENRFQVSWGDSGDKLDNLAASEFGYLSRHYIVSVQPGAFPEDLFPAELAEAGLKAEIQVRTVLQHAWADINHELNYKNRFQLPRKWQREFARLAAVLEEADRDFDGIREGLAEYATSYGAYMSERQLRAEIEKLKIVLEAEPSSVSTAHELAGMAMSLEDWELAVEVLNRYRDAGSPGLIRDLGVSLCKLHGGEPDGDGFQQGQTALQQACELAPNDANAWAALGGTWRKREAAAGDDAARAQFRAEARACYRRGFEADATDPYPLGNYIEYEVAEHPELDVVSYFRPSLDAARRRCRMQVDVGINMPWSYFDLGKFHLLLREPESALAAYAAGVARSSADFFVASALGSFATLQSAASGLPGFDWSRLFLTLARAFRFQKQDDEIPPSVAEIDGRKGPVVILAGYCARPADADHRQLLHEAFAGFPGTIVSGGTRSGISALAGELQETFAADIRTIGYLPEELPDGVERDGRYSELIETGGPEFSPLQPLQYWADLLAAGVPTEEIRLLAVGGGELTASECRMALALGVPVAYLDDGSSVVGEGLSQDPWRHHPQLHRIEADVTALRRFLCVS